MRFDPTVKDVVSNGCCTSMLCGAGESSTTRDGTVVLCRTIRNETMKISWSTHDGVEFARINDGQREWYDIEMF